MKKNEQNTELCVDKSTKYNDTESGHIMDSSSSAQGVKADTVGYSNLIKDRQKNKGEGLEKIKAVMLGHAVGDALGVPVEFFAREELDEKPVTTMEGFGTYPMPEGCWSDDTSMALAALDSLASGKINYEQIMENFVRWVTLEEYTPTGVTFDMGRTCLEAIRRYIDIRGDATLCGLDGEHSNGNGSLMRIHPFALFLYNRGIADEEHIEFIHKASALTHAHERSKMACGIYAFILWELLQNPCRESVKRGLLRARNYYADYEECATYDKMLFSRIADISKEEGSTGACQKIRREEIKSTGYVVDTLEAAIWCILTTKDYKECVLKAVNLGEDTDTVAAIAGGLAGALYGFESIPKEWLTVLKKREYIEKMCESAYSVW